MPIPKILVAAPVSNHKDYIIRQWIKHIKMFTYPNYDVLLIDNSKDKSYHRELKKQGVNVGYVNPRNMNSYERITYSQNVIRKAVLHNNYHGLMSIECDVFPPLDAIERMVYPYMPVIGGLYFIKNGANTTPMLQKDTSTNINYNNQTISFHNNLVTLQDGFLFADGSIKKVHSTGLGCCFIHKDVLRLIEFRVEFPYEKHSDSYFSIDCQKLGIKTFVDTNLLCTHVNKSWEGMD